MDISARTPRRSPRKKQQPAAQTQWCDHKLEDNRASSLTACRSCNTPTEPFFDSATITPRRAPAWQRKPRATAVNGKTRTVWKRHDIHSQQSKDVDSSLQESPQSSPEKVTKKVCLNDVVVPTKDRRRGVPATWDRRKSTHFRKYLFYRLCKGTC